MIIRNRSDHRLPQEGDKLLIVKYSALGDVSGLLLSPDVLNITIPSSIYHGLLMGKMQSSLKISPLSMNWSSGPGHAG